MSNGAWWVAKGVIVPASVAAPIIWLILRVWVDEPQGWVVFGWSVFAGLVVVWVGAATLNGRRADLESSVLTPGHRNRRP